MQATGSNFFHMVDYADVDGEALRAAEGWTLTLGLLLIKRDNESIDVVHSRLQAQASCSARHIASATERRNPRQAHAPHSSSSCLAAAAAVPATAPVGTSSPRPASLLPARLLPAPQQPQCSKTTAPSPCWLCPQQGQDTFFDQQQLRSPLCRSLLLLLSLRSGRTPAAGGSTNCNGPLRDTHCATQTTRSAESRVN